VHVDGRIYGSFYPGRKGWAALDATDGRQLYDAPDLVKGAALWADGRLLVYSENGWMRLLAPGAERFEVKGEFRFADAGPNDAWAHPVVHQGRLYLRYHERLACFDVKAN
jgi:outer membrane protein assembly factor BamB